MKTEGVHFRLVTKTVTLHGLLVGLALRDKSAKECAIQTASTDLLLGLGALLVHLVANSVAGSLETGSDSGIGVLST